MFNCTQCGLCCKNIYKSPYLKDYQDIDGVCKYLDRKTNLCTIYATRPLVCNVSKYYDTYFEQKMSREEFYELNYQSCRRLQNEAVFGRSLLGGASMYLATLSEKQKKLFLDLSIFSMQSDGVIEPREQELVYQYCGEMEIERRKEAQSKSIEEVLKELKSISTESELKKITIELVALMYADEDFADEEKELLTKLADTFEFTSHIMGEIVFATRHLLLSHKMLSIIVK